MITLLLMVFTSLLPQSQASGAPHEPLQIKNTFSHPEDVVRYYCGRDASGFVWSGLLDIERLAFTVWKESPQKDSFYIAKDYDIKAKEVGSDRAEVEVTYHLIGIGDAFGTRYPPYKNPYQVTFQLKRVSGSWKIEKPEPAEIAPVVVEAKFGYSN